MIVSHYNLCNLVLSFSWTFISQSRLKFVFCKRIWSKDVFFISTQWIFSWLDNHRLIMNWWWSCKDIILSVLIKIFDIFFFWLPFYVKLCCSLATAVDHSYKKQERTEEFLYVGFVFNTIYKLWFIERLQAFS